MYWQRRLPHLAPDGATVFVTWRLAGTLPASKSRSRGDDLTAGATFARDDRELDRTQSGSKWLKDSRVANAVAAVLLHGEAMRSSYALLAWVIMPNHVHVLFTLKEDLSDSMRWIKSASAKRANEILRRSGPFWQREYYDHWVRSREEYGSITRYIEWNPVHAGLVNMPENWRWSNARKTPAAATAGATCDELGG